jgi:uncharacterized protein with von Willebrand factor type A (vWA) domain
VSPIVEHLLRFVRSLRDEGIFVPAAASIDAMQALDLIGIRRRSDVQDALRAVLVSRHEDLARFDRAFDRLWRPRRTSRESNRPEPIRVPPRGASRVEWHAQASVSSGDQSDDGSVQEGEGTIRTYSPDEAWRTRDFAALDAREAALARTVIAGLAWTPGLRVTRRWISGGNARAVDFRRLFRSYARHSGEPMVIPRRERHRAVRPLVLICDVSGSMEPYARMLLLFAHALAQRHRSVELFAFSTRLTRITRQFVGRPASRALSNFHDAVRDWAGGTRIGEALRTFNMEWSRRVLRRGPTVLLISDGWDLGEPELLKAEMARLKRSSFRLIWLNPLVGSPDYEPLTRGLKAALPYVDDFLSVRNMASLEALAAHLASLPSRKGQIGRPADGGSSRARAGHDARAGEEPRWN